MSVLRIAAATAVLVHATCASGQVITTYAGTGTAGYNGDDPAQTALTAQLNSPFRGAVDAAGNLYVVDSANHRVRKITPAGVITTVTGTGVAGGALTQVNNPAGIAVDISTGDVYVADTLNHRILRLAGGAAPATVVAGTGVAGLGASGVAATTSQLSNPLGVAHDGAGTLFISDSANHRVRKVVGGTVTDIAGVAGSAGCAANMFNFPRGLDLAPNGDLYIADSANNRVMRLSGGATSAFVGSNVSCPIGNADGPVATAGLNAPTTVALTELGDLLIADRNNHKIRRVRAGQVTTVVGTGAATYSGDNGPAAAAALNGPTGVVAGPPGSHVYYIGDAGNHRIRKVAPAVPAAPTLTTATAGVGQATLGFTHTVDPNAPAASFTASCSPGPVSQAGSASPIVLTGLTNATLYTCSVTAANVSGTSAASNTLTVTPGAAPGITGPALPTGTLGLPYGYIYGSTGAPTPTFSVTSGALPPGLTLSPSGTLSGVPTAVGTYTGVVTASNGIAPAATQNFSITVHARGTLLNISTRMQVLTGNDVLIGGFIVGGVADKTVVVRARGPSLIPFGITNALLDPMLRLVRSSDQADIATNDNWGAAANAAAITASGFAPSNDFESAILATLSPGAYTAVVSGKSNTIGVGIVEVFEVDAPQVPLANISTRGMVSLGNDVMIGGFVINGPGSQRVVVRARGPSLVPFGIANALANPQLQLVRASDQAVIGANDDWQSASNAADITASGFAPSNALESAILMDLAPGAYTAVVSGVSGGVGVGIVEVFIVN